MSLAIKADKIKKSRASRPLALSGARVQGGRAALFHQARDAPGSQGQARKQRGDARITGRVLDDILVAGSSRRRCIHSATARTSRSEIYCQASLWPALLQLASGQWVVAKAIQITHLLQRRTNLIAPPAACTMVAWSRKSVLPIVGCVTRNLIHVCSLRAPVAASLSLGEHVPFRPAAPCR